MIIAVLEYPEDDQAQVWFIDISKLDITDQIQHRYFDNMWKRKKHMSRYEARTEAYKWLSLAMRIGPEFTHIGMFDISQCKEVVEMCKPFFKNKH